MNYLDILNPEQRAAVLQTEGPVMIIAGAGSGKTRVLTYRVAHLIDKGTDPFHILSLTFTNRAALEMRTRIEAAIGSKAKNIWMGTFHSVFAKILRIEAQKINYPSNFTIYDTEDSKTLLKNIVKEQDLDDKAYKTGMALGRISSAKNRLISAQQYMQNSELVEEDILAGRPEMGRLYKIYQDRCYKASAMDFDDLLFNTNVLFRNHLDTLHKYQHKFRYIMVDEYQDTNLSQYLIIKKLAAVHQNICVVGDDAQSIYAFRGANIDNILNFEKDYPDLNIYKLEQNYRSTVNIVEAANSLIKHNQRQLRKNVWTENSQGNQIDLLRNESENDEGRLVSRMISDAKMRNGYKNQDFAVLYRTNAQSRALEEALRRDGIAYRIIGGLSFYQRKEVKDLIAYLRLSVNPNDEQSLRRIINLPKRGIGEATVSKIIVTAYDNDTPLWDVVSNITRILSGRSANSISSFADLMNRFMISATSLNASAVASQIAKESGLLKELYEDKTIEGISRYENVQELLNAIKDFTDTETNLDKSLGAFLQEIALLTETPSDKAENPDKVTLMTIHSAKGLEFKHVFVAGLEENLFPSSMMLSSKEDLEEERRLFYVAITRAEQHLSLSYATSRYRFGHITYTEPSRFLKEIDAQYLNIRQSARKSDKSGSLSQAPTRFADQFKRSNAAAQLTQDFGHTATPNFVPGDLRKLRAGMRVEHSRFGFGQVIELQVDGPEKKARILFEKAGERTLMLSFAKLMLHEF